MDRLTYRGTAQMTEDGMITPSYSDYPVRRIIERLAEYEDAEEQGLLLRLPCKVGDTVYELINEGISCPILIIQTMFTLQDLPLFEEKRMFLTKEEAEQALEAMKGGAE